MPRAELDFTLEILRALVRFDSTSARPTGPIVDYICEALSRPGVELLRVATADQAKSNLVAWLGPPTAADRGGLVLSGHMDCVPAAEPEWRTDPFDLVEAGERCYGRGSSDMKAFLALAIRLATELDVRRLRRPLVLIFTYDEEVGTLGARRFLECWPRERLLPRACVIGEPTSLHAARLHKGHLKLRVRLRGKSAHSGYPQLGDNAIEKAGPVIAALAELRRALEAERPAHAEHFPEAPFVPLNLGTIQGGVAVNIVPARCEIELGLRHLPGMKAEELVGRIEEALGAALETSQAGALELVNESPPLLLAEDARVYREVAGLVGQRETRSVGFATDAGWLQRLGLECVLFGPGAIEVAHRPNEFVPKADLTRAAGFLDTLVERFSIDA